MPVPVNVIVAPATPVESDSHSSEPDNSGESSANDKIVVGIPLGQGEGEGEGEGEGVILLPGCWVITFEELKVHEPPAVQFWSVMMLLPLFENFALADVLPIATVLNNIAAIGINTDVVDLLLIL
jgi:hypothetical protein